MKKRLFVLAAVVACVALAVNRDFGRVTENGGIEYAPDMIAPLLRVPTESDYLAAGWLKIVRSAPSVPEGCHVSASRLEARDGQISRVYEYAKDEPPVVRYSKLKLGDQLEALGLYDIAEAWMVSNRVFRQWRDAQYFESNYPVLIAATNLVVSSGLVTGEQMRAALEAARDE